MDDLSDAKGAGPFFSPGKRKSLFALGKERAGAEEVSTTGQVCALLGRPPRWQVEGDPSLDFEFVARELTPMSSLKGDRRVWLRKSPERRLSLDALLVNADDRTPIVAEIKVKGDENAELALIQALAAAAQLSNKSQLQRLYREYRDFFDLHAPPQTLDVYVVTVGSPERGTRPALAKRAHELTESEALSRWIRRIAFIEMTLENGQPTFRALA